MSNQTKKKMYNITSLNYKIKNLLWRIGTFEKMEDCSLSLSLNVKESSLDDLTKIIACFKFQVEGYSISGTRVNFLAKSNYKIEKASFKDQNVKISKKARCILKSGFYEIRLN